MSWHWFLHIFLNWINLRLFFKWNFRERKKIQLWSVKRCEIFPENPWSGEEVENHLPLDGRKPLDQELQAFCQGTPPPEPGVLASHGFYISKKIQTHTPQKEGTQPAHRAGISEINLSIGAALTLHRRKWSLSFIAAYACCFPSPIKLPTRTTTSNYCFSEANSKMPYFITERIFLVCVSASIMSYSKGENEIKILSEIFIDLIKPPSLS